MVPGDHNTIVFDSRLVFVGMWVFWRSMLWTIPVHPSFLRWFVDSWVCNWTVAQDGMIYKDLA